MIKEGKIGKSRVLAAAAMLAAVFLSGCGDPDPVPAFTFDEIRYWFEDETLVVNVTLTNRGNFTPYTPDLVFQLQQYEPDGESATGSTPKSLREIWPRLESIHVLFDLGFVPNEKKPRYYEGDTAPMPLPPGTVLNVEFGINATKQFQDDSGYYVVELEMFAPSPYEFGGASANFYSGCFNRNTPEFYGDSPDGHVRCYYYDESGRISRHGYGIYGPEWVGTPRMVHDSPEETAGAA